MNTEMIQISSGSGPIEVRAFVAKLAERIEQLCLERGLSVQEIEHDGPEEAPRSVLLRVNEGATLSLASELGTHLLLARSKSRGRASRKRWYASVSAHPEERADKKAAALVSEDDLVITACRAGG